MTAAESSEEWAELSEELAGELGAQSTEDSEDEQTGVTDDSPDSEAPGMGFPDEPGEFGEMGETPSPTVAVGDLYCNTLATAAASVRDRYGEEEFNRESKIEEYKVTLKSELELNHFFDLWFRENFGAPDQMSPGQGVVAMTLLFGAIVAMEDPSVVDGLMEEYDL